MNSRREFEIAFVGLKPGVHEFTYEITDRFFEEYGEQDFWDCQAAVKLLLEKTPNFMMLRFQVGGTVKVVCDRCSSNLPLNLFEDFTVTVKAVENPEEMNDTEEDPDVYYISRGESHLHVAPMIYEFVNLSIPMQKECEYEAMDGPYCNPAAREALEKMKKAEEEKENPLWKGLEKFKGLEE
ncbi:YceD family protein [Flavisolibacter ginsenosidimutans]|uniref:DUF177 domain-containing protein n=1 Tax=Flavisolibacter ginsenosidimutans TaxID=661481 RepID=A0A5B8UJL0_9BACT|nr:DUF177 domain-containing protein [Flavisolibacter ginsenosidimutans]QEC56250.1 DUF177 domain-containing protein [Flavisolibacter ginsenosidimutans]